MFVAADFVPLLLAIFLSFHESETASTAFTARPSDPSYAVEGRDFTLEWTYTLDGTVGFSQFFIVSVNGRKSVGKKFGPGNITSEPKYQARFKAQATNTRAELTILAVQRSDETRYQVNVAPTGTGSLQHEVAVIVLYQPNITFTSVNQTVNDSDTVWLNCTASGFPKPNINWTRLSTKRDVKMSFDIMGKQDEGVYRCTANNGIGNPATADVFVTVQFYRPFNTNFSTNLTNAASLNETFYLMCSAEANPKAEYRLYKEDERVSNITAGSENIGLYETSVGDRIKQVVYKCIPFNSFGDGPTKTLNITMHYSVKATGSGENVTVAIGKAKTFTCPVDGNPDPKIEWYNNKTGKKISGGKQLKARESGCYTCVASNSLGTTVNVTQCLIVDPNLTLPPTTSTSQRSTSAPSTTKQTSSEPEGTSSPSSTKPTSSEPEVSAGPPWVIIVAVTGGVVVLLIVVGVLTWWVHKQRKCTKDTKIHNSDLERDEGGYSQVQGAYAQSGPPAANGAGSAAEQQLEVEAAIPTYAVVDKSKKSKMQADEKPPEYAVVDKSKKKEKQEAAAIPTYSAVDKSKKKKKSHEEVPAVYAEVDKSKKKKKKKIDDKNLYENFDEPKKEKKPGELLYADLGDFQNPSMPAVSTSPQPLPAIKKADPYERTDYADITQFLKGNATLPPNDGNGDTEMKPKRLSKKKEIQGNDKETPI